MRLNKGRKALEAKLVIPEVSAIFNKPNHKHKIPVKFRQILKAAF